MKKGILKGKRLPLGALGLVFALLVMGLLWYVNVTNSRQSMSPVFPTVYFDGEYQVDQGPWQPVTRQHIPATRGDVTLRGKFQLIAPDGEPLGPATAGFRLAIYLNHIHVSIQEGTGDIHAFDVESSYAGEDLCGEFCLPYTLKTEETVTMRIHNPHRFGNESAIDELLRELAGYAGTTFEKNYMDKGNTERTVGILFLLSAFVVLGTALFTSLLQLPHFDKLWLTGLCILFAAGYFVYNATGVFYWSDSVIGNTTILGSCVMLYMLCVCALLSALLLPGLKKPGIALVTALGALCVGLAFACIFTDLRFYDTWLWWALGQSVVNVALGAMLIPGFRQATGGQKLCMTGAWLLLSGFQADLLAIHLGWWQGGVVSGCIFSLLFLVTMVFILRIIPKNINAVRRAKEIEGEQKVLRAQLQENRIAIMISQIQPHFIYNTLGTIEQLCKEEPEQAAQLAHSFSLFLRGNFSQLDNTAPIRFAQELEHVRYYTQIELVRFPDMTVNYDIQTEEFLLPALSVQPLVENAIKHGLMGLEQGGTVTVSAYETENAYCVKVTDDGVGFDTQKLWDEQKHIGIRNVRERLQAMCGGKLTVESAPGKGTVALIQLPKEGTEL